MMILLRRPRPSQLASLRRLHASAKRSHLVAPPDPISNMRPIIYQDAPLPAAQKLLRHPYSLAEFDASQDPLGDYELQYRMQRQQLDAFHQNFWLDSNTRFEMAKSTVLNSLPLTATPLDKENALSEFYRHWVMQEKERTDAYTTEWRRRNFALIRLSVRLKYQKLSASLANIFTSTSRK